MRSLDRDNQAPEHDTAGVNVLHFCRCMDCAKHVGGADGAYQCLDLIGGTGARWSDGNQECDPSPDTWHYCGGYDGPRNAQEPVLWPRTQKLDHRDNQQAKPRKTASDDSDFALPKRLREKATTKTTHGPIKLPKTATLF